MYFDPINMDAQDALVYYKGPFDNQVLTQFNVFLKEEDSIPPRTTNRIFSVFVELAQNISKYSVEYNHFKDEKGHGVGVFAIYKEDNIYELKSGNLVDIEKGRELQQRCEEINRQDKEGLKEMRREINAKPLPKNATGGNIGLIQVALKSQSQLKTELVPTQDERFGFFTVSISIGGSK